MYSVYRVVLSGGKVRESRPVLVYIRAGYRVLFPPSLLCRSMFPLSPLSPSPDCGSSSCELADILLGLSSAGKSNHLLLCTCIHLSAYTPFSSSAVLVHKTFHRYTVRAKRGTAQSARDAQSGGHGPKYVRQTCSLRVLWLWKV